LGKLFSFKGGVHPHHFKSQTEHLQTEVFPAPDKVFIPLSQHIGAPAKPVVKPGDRVLVGQVLAEPSGFISAYIHSSIAGKVISINPYPHPLGKHVLAVEIENDKTDEHIRKPSLPPWNIASKEDLIQRVSSAGIVGMGGASFPTHVKLSPPDNKPIDTVIINGAECEPYLTADHRLMLEKTDALLIGALIIKKILSAKDCFIAVENNKPDALEVIESKLNDQRFKDLTLVRLRAKYPQGGEKQLINAVTGRMVPSGSLPMEAQCVVQNIGTAVAIHDAVVEGVPLYQRVVTVTGSTVRSAKNFLARVGTPVNLLLDACDTDMEATKKVISGGPMMGLAQSDLQVPVIKSTSGILAVERVVPAVRAFPCISCGRCVKACPIHLVPSRLAKLVERERVEETIEWNIMDCIECGSCAYACPSKINLVQFMKLGKYNVQQAKLATEQKK